MVFYSQTHKFFDTHYDEIEEIREEWRDSVGEDIFIQGDLKNFLAWFAFEQCAHEIYTQWFEG